MGGSVNPSSLLSCCLLLLPFTMSGDSDSKALHSEHLDDSGNYSEWSIRMEAELTRRGLLKVVVFEGEVGKSAEEVEKDRDAWKKNRTAKKMG
jgi:hypothetical protein